MQPTVLLLAFATCTSLLMTLAFYAVHVSPWVAVFSLAVGGVVLFLENVSLYQEIDIKDSEIKVLQATYSPNVLKKMKYMETELHFLKQDRDRLKISIANYKRTLMGRHSTGSLMGDYGSL
jgi:hypothetical protein